MLASMEVDASAAFYPGNGSHVVASKQPCLLPNLSGPFFSAYRDHPSAETGLPTSHDARRLEDEQLDHGIADTLVSATP
jgi:hypothetical protein